MLKVFLSLTFLLSLSAQAQVEQIDLTKEFKTNTVVNLYDPGTEKKLTKLSPLAQMKFYQIKKKWSDCVRLAPKVFAKNKDLKSWIGVTWLQCLSKGDAKAANVKTALDAIAQNAQLQGLQAEGPWHKDLWQIWLQLELPLLADDVAHKTKNIGNKIDEILVHNDDLNKEQKALLYQYLGDLALARNDYDEALFIYEESQGQKDSKYVADKIDFLNKTQDHGGADKSDKADKDDSKDTAPELVSDEQKIEDRIRQDLKQNDLIPAAKDTVLLLNLYPGSKAAKHYKEKPLEIYLSISDKVESANGGVLRDKILAELENADAASLLDWAQNLHRKADYPASLRLAQKAYDKNPTSPTAVTSLWVAGRSAHFLGQYPVAQAIFQKMIDTQGGTDEAAEALFRLALINYRQKNYSNAAALLEKLLAQGRDRYDLTAQYWLVRSLETVNKDRAQTLSVALQEKYPFSYYGLRLRAEGNKNKLTWPDPPAEKLELESVFYVVGTQKKSWQRFKALSEAGWWGEAQVELANLPPMDDPTLKIQLAKILAERQQYPLVIHLINDAFEADPTLRRAEFVKLAYPAVFETQFKQEARRYDLDPVLLESLTRQESAFNMRAISTSHAQGLMQMIPPTAQDVAKRLGFKLELPEDMYRPDVNIPMGSFYISQMIEQFNGNIPMSLAAYNAGPARLDIWLGDRPETSELRGRPSSAPLDEVWFDELPWTETSLYIKSILRNVLLYKLTQSGSYDLDPVLWQGLHNKKAM